MTRFVSFVGAQLCWWACVLLADTAGAVVGVIVTVVWVALHVLRSPRPRVDLGLAIAATLLGIVVDSALVAVDAIAFPASVRLGPLPTPLWMVALWTGFSTMLDATLRPVVTVWWRAVLFGLVGGPLSYLGGARLGPITIGPASDTGPALVAVGVAWALAMMALSVLHRRLTRDHVDGLTGGAAGG